MTEALIFLHTRCHVVGTCRSHKIMCCSHQGMSHRYNILSLWHVPWCSTSWSLCSMSRTKLPKNFVTHRSFKLSGHTRGLVAATCPSDMNRSCYIFICVYAMRLCRYSSPICEQDMSLVVAAGPLSIHFVLFCFYLWLFLRLRNNVSHVQYCPLDTSCKNVFMSRKSRLVVSTRQTWVVESKSASH